MMQISTGSQSARVDTTTEGLEASSTRVPGVKYFAGANSVEELVLKEQGRYFEIVRELFRPLSGQ